MTDNALPQVDVPALLSAGKKSAPVVVLAHGAGAPMDSDFMNTMSDGLVDRGLRCVRFEFPYMHKRRVDGKKRGPDRQPVLLATWRAVIGALGDPARLCIGGKSMGGRMATLVADDAGVGALCCLGYPFHPPGKPEKRRTAHLETLQTPTLILQGERDTFGTRDEVAGYALSSTIDVRFLDDGDHSLKPRKKSGRTLEQNLAEALDALAAFVGETLGGAG